ncbi:ATP-binding protein [Pedobacter psychrodurus]|uniref:ATP-binding protein n=1 Tax=Pedobacter psychrodurus TaxID=2530456 RepID=A0A4R0Q7M8_9SPHI|nr:ATP-binding protein [Pedobacter psychrodurus]TCD29446.1 ATP-binding protein [Pedobacter psychrodurus]
MLIIRNLASQLRNRLKKSPAIAILGPRQVGKTTLAKELSNDYIYLDMENPRDVAKLQDAYTFLESLQDHTVIIDEVQLLPTLFSLLRPLIDAKRTPGRFILLGSASPELVKGVSETLAGRISYNELCPIGLTELPDTIGFEQHWFRGGFPESLLSENDLLSKEWIDDFIVSYVERDLAKMFGVDLAPTLLRNFWSMLAHLNGNLFNGESFARSLGVSAPTVNRYLDFLEGGFLIRRLQPWFVNAKKRLIKSPKTYIRDTGILHRLLNIPRYSDLFGHPGVGASWEGYVVEQIYQIKEKQTDLFFYRTQTGAECDLILVQGITTLACIEIKLSNAPTISKGFINCIKDLEPKYRYIITPKSETYVTANDITVTNIKHFLLDILPQIQ